jgi:disintegrin and metalloproteinase domain-containing protein 8
MERGRALSTLLVLVAPFLAAGLHGEEFATQLAATPHEVVDFLGEQHNSPPTLRLEVSTHGYELIVALEKHTALFAPGFVHIAIHPNGSVLSREVRGPNGHCIYRGYLFNASSTAPIGDALVSVCDGKIEGRLRIGATHDLIVAPHPAKDGRHAVFRRTEFEDDAFACGVTDEEDAAAADRHRERNAFHVDEAAQRRRLITGNVDKYVELLVVNDKAHCDSFTDAGELLGDMTTRSAAIVAFMSALYESGHSNAPNFDYNIHFVLTAMVSFPLGDPYTAAMTGGETNVDGGTGLLNSFQEWRIDSVAVGSVPGHDNGHLLSGLDFTGSTVGYAGVSAMCNPARSDGITMARAFRAFGTERERVKNCWRTAQRAIAPS